MNLVLMLGVFKVLETFYLDFRWLRIDWVWKLNGFIIYYSIL